MNAKIGTVDDLKNQQFLFEPKLDGIRALCYVNKQLRFISRNQKNLTDKYPELADNRSFINAKSAILDGEIVAYDELGNPRFSLLQQGYAATYVVFDILMKDGNSLVDMALTARKKILDETVTSNEHFEKIFFTQNGMALWQEMVKRNLQGVMAKKLNGHYYPGLRSGTWLKIKLFNTIDCVIAGYLVGKRAIASLALGLYDDEGQLQYIGNVGTGFSEKTIEALLAHLEKLKKATLAIKNKENAPTHIQWVKPQLVAEIKYLELTPYNILRAPVFLRLRPDKEPRECTFKEQLKI